METRFAVYAFRIFMWIPNRNQCRVMLRPFDAGRSTLHFAKSPKELAAVACR